MVFIWKTVSELEHYPDWIRLFMMRPGNAFQHKVTNIYFDRELLPYIYDAYEAEIFTSNILAIQKALMKRRKWSG